MHQTVPPTTAAELALLCILCRLAYIPLYALDLDLLRTCVWATGFLTSVCAVLIAAIPQVMLPHFE